MEGHTPTTEQGCTVTAEQLAAEKYRIIAIDGVPSGYAVRNAFVDGYLTARTITAEQVDAARDSILYDKNRGIEIAIHSPGFDGKSLNDAATELATLAFRAAGLLIEGEE